MNRSGLKRVVKSVRGSKGTVNRAYWVRSDSKLASKDVHAEGAFKRVSGKPITAHEFMKQHGHVVAGYGATIGAASHVGGQVGWYAAGRSTKNYHAAELGKQIGQFVTSWKTGKALYNTQRGKKITASLQNATLGAHLAFLATHFGTAMTSMNAAERIQHRVQYR